MYRLLVRYNLDKLVVLEYTFDISTNKRLSGMKMRWEHPVHSKASQRLVIRSITLIALSHYRLRLPQRWEIPQFALRASLRPAAWEMSLPNWTTMEHMC